MTGTQKAIVGILALLTVFVCGILAALVGQELIVGAVTRPPPTPTSLATATFTPVPSPKMTATPISAPTATPPATPKPSPTATNPPSTTRAQYAATMLEQLDRLTEAHELLERTVDLFSENQIDYADTERMLTTISDSLDSQVATLSNLTPPPEWAELHEQTLLFYQTYHDAISIALSSTQEREANPFGATFDDKLDDADRELDRTLLLMEEYEVLK